MGLHQTRFVLFWFYFWFCIICKRVTYCKFFYLGNCAFSSGIFFPIISLSFCFPLLTFCRLFYQTMPSLLVISGYVNFNTFCKGHQISNFHWVKHFYSSGWRMFLLFSISYLVYFYTNFLLYFVRITLCWPKRSFDRGSVCLFVY